MGWSENRPHLFWFDVVIKFQCPYFLATIEKGGYGKMSTLKFFTFAGTDELVNKQQIFRNTSQYQTVYEFGRTYVSFGYVDLWNLMDGTYMGFETESLKFYGYDQGEVTVARSLVMLEMIKAPFEEISAKTILQVRNCHR